MGRRRTPAGGAGTGAPSGGSEGAMPRTPPWAPRPSAGMTSRDPQAAWETRRGALRPRAWHRGCARGGGDRGPPPRSFQRKQLL